MLPLDAALLYAQAGLEVLPLHTILGGICSCGDDKCPSPGKHPLISSGFKAASTDPELITRWFTTWPKANIGCRPRARGLVLDVDPRNGGDMALENWVADHGSSPPTAYVETGGGGQHLWYSCDPVRNRKYINGNRYAGIDIISATGYVVMPPSIHASGRTYEWEASDDPLEDGLLNTAALPEAWRIPIGNWNVQLDDTADARVSVLDAPRRQPTNLTPADPAELTRVQLALRQIDPDCDYSTWLQVGQALHQTCWEESFDVWLNWSQLGEKFPGAGALQAKWATFDIDGAVGLGSLFHLAGPIPSTSPGQAAPSGASPQLPSPPPFVRADEFAASMQAPEYIVDGIIRKRYLYALTGHSNAGKTAIAVDQACCVAMGMPWAGLDTGPPGTVLFLAGENDEDVRGRIRGWCELNKVDPGELGKWLWVMPVAGPIESFLPYIQEWAQEHGPIKSVYVDSKLPYFGGTDENENVEALGQAKSFRALTALPGGPAVVILCHPTKGAVFEESLLPRGGYAFTNELDTNLTAYSDGELTRLHHLKIRGATFDPLHFQMLPTPISGMTDNHGRDIFTVCALHIEHAETAQEAAHDETMQLLTAVYRGRGDASMRDMETSTGISKTKIQRKLDKLAASGLVNQPEGNGGKYKVTPKGVKVVKERAQNTGKTPW